MTTHEERGARLTHRIEAFSDLVIGFSLALLGLTLVIPEHAVALLLNLTWLVAYFWTFGIIVLMWLSHHRLFGGFFVPTPLCTGLNFVFLSMLGLIVYFVQVFVHAHTDYDHAIALLMYFTAFSVAFVTLGTLFAIGVKTRWHELEGKERFAGLARSVRFLTVGTAMLIGIGATPFVFVELHMRSTATLAVAAAVGAVIARLSLRMMKPRILAGA